MTRTTVSLESDVESMLMRLMAERGISFKEAVNSTIRRALSGDQAQTDITFPTFDMGAPTVDYAKASQLAADLEDGVVVSEMATGR